MEDPLRPRPLSWILHYWGSALDIINFSEPRLYVDTYSDRNYSDISIGQEYHKKLCRKKATWKRNNDENTTKLKIKRDAKKSNALHWIMPVAYDRWGTAPKRQGWRLLSQFVPFSLFSQFFSLAKAHLSYGISRSYLGGAAAPQRGHLSNMNMVQRIEQVFLIFPKGGKLTKGI